MNTIQEQILFGYAVREAAYEAGLLTEKPSSLKEDTQGFADAWIEEFKRQNNKNNMGQIKVGDIVRVSKDITQIYRKVNSMGVFEQTFKVLEIDSDGMTLLDSTPPRYVTLIPTKYLIKVNAEPKFSKGDKVFCMCDGEVYEVEAKTGKYHYALKGRSSDVHEDLLEPYSEPKEPVSDSFDSISEGTANELSDEIEAYVKTLRNISDNFDWQRYEADLARDIAVKITNKHMDGDPKDVGAYAVEVAKSVVENLKKK